jgi:hypothetical protein
MHHTCNLHAITCPHVVIIDGELHTMIFALLHILDDVSCSGHAGGAADGNFLLLRPYHGH